MIRLRTRVLALCVLGALPLYSPAASIRVTTPYDIVANDDELCSIREAVTASEIAAKLNKRKGAENALLSAKDALEKALLDIEERPDLLTYPRLDMLAHVETMVVEMGDTDLAPLHPELVADLAVFKPKIQALAAPHGTFDFSIAGGNRYPTLADDDLQPGYYTYLDTDMPHESAASVIDAANRDMDFDAVANNELIYNVGDRAYWDGTYWRRFTPSDRIPDGVDIEGVREGIELLDRVLVATRAEIERLEGLAEIDGCDDGSSFDIILLEDTSECPGEPEDGVACHFKVNAVIDMPVRLTVRGSGRSTVVERCSTGSCGGVPSTGLHRLFTVPQGMSTEFANMTFRGGDAGTGEGGAIHTKGSLSLSNTRFESNRAAQGGALHVDSTGSLVMENVRFIDNAATAGNGGAVNLSGSSVRMTNVVMGEYVPNIAPATGFRLAGNTATGNGGGIAVVSSLNGTLAIVGGALIGNRATRGSAIYMDCMTTTFSIENATVAENRATDEGSINFSLPPAGVGNILINNVTIIRNTAASGSAGISLNRLIPLQIYNSVIAGNTDQSAGLRPDCDFSVGVLNVNDFRRNYYGNTLGAVGDACPGSRYPSPVPELENFELGTFQLIGDLLNPMDPAVGPYYVPVFPDDTNDSTENRLVNRGAGTQEVSRCTASDQRGDGRSSSVDEECDIGAVEYQIGRRQDEIIGLDVDERRCLSLIGDDIGDANYVPGSLRVYDIERSGFTATVVSRVPGSPDNNPGVDPLLDLDVVCPNAADLPYREAVLVIPARGFRGETDVIYGSDWRTAGSSPLTGTVTSIAHIQTESRTGITTSTLGAVSPLSMLLLAGLLLVRRMRVGIAAGLLALGSAAAVAEENVIYVNSGLDEPVVTTPGDGRCTLREAFDTARNDRANMSGGDCLDGNEGPDVIEFAAGLTEVVLEGPVIAYGNVGLRCPEPPEPAAGQPQAPRQTCKIRRRAFESDGTTPNPNPFRLIDSRGSLTITRIVFEDGQTPDRGSGQDGGAIFSVGSLTILDSVFRNNSAVSGGAIFLSGAGSSLNIANSVFVGNSSRAGTEILGGAVVGPTPAGCPALARGGVDGLVGSRLAGGGAIATTQSDSHKIAIQASSFERNCAVAGAAATDLNSRSSIVVANSTYSGNISLQGPGAIDVSGALGNATLRNVTVLENQSGISRVRETWDAPVGTLQRRAVQFGVAGVTMSSSVIAANVTVADPSVAANCAPPGASLGSFYNVFGDQDDLATAEVGYTCTALPNTGDKVVFATEVYNASSPLSGMLSALVDVEVDETILRMYVINSAAPNASVLVDAGYNDGGLTAQDNQVDPVFSSTGKCANVDARGASRESGGRCDIGAFEVLGLTAKDDSANNRGRADRLVVVSPIDNDIFDDISALPEKALKKNCDTTQVLADTPVANARTYRFVGADTDADVDANPDVCIEVVVPASEYAAPATPTSPPTGAGEVVFCYADMDADDEPRCEDATPASGYVVLYDNHRVLRNEDLSAGAIVLSYRAYTGEQVASNPAPIILAVENLSPQAISDKVTVIAGATASINVLANDVDPDSSSTGGLRLTSISGSGCVAEYASDLVTILFWECQFGRVTMDPLGVVTWTPINTFNPFSEEITYEVSDQDPVTGQKGVSRATVKFIVGRPASNGGSLLGKDDASDILGLDFLGAPSPLFFAIFMLALGRRRG